MNHVGAPFAMFCNCGPGGSLRKVRALRIMRKLAPRYAGQGRRPPVPMNVCCSCKKLWPSPPVRKPRADAQPASYIERRRAQWAEARRA